MVPSNTSVASHIIKYK